MLESVFNISRAFQTSLHIVLIYSGPDDSELPRIPASNKLRSYVMNSCADCQRNLKKHLDRLPSLDPQMLPTDQHPLAVLHIKGGGL